MRQGGYSPLGASEEKGVSSFKDKAREFWGVWESLSEKRGLAESSNPELRNEYRELMDRGVTIRNNIERITSVIDSAARGYASAVDYTSRGMESAVNWFKGSFGLGGLNAIPLIPVAVIAVAMAAISKWLKDAYVVNKKLDMVDSLVEKGMSPSQAAGIANKTVSGPSFLNIGTGVGLPLIAAAVIGFLYFTRGRR